MTDEIFEGLVPVEGLPTFVAAQLHRVWDALDTVPSGQVLVAREVEGNEPIDLRAFAVDALPAHWRARLEEVGFLPLAPFPSRVLLCVALTGELVGYYTMTPHPRRVIA